MVMDVIKVRMADFNTAKAPYRIKTTGLGSCVGIVLYDKKTQIGGMAHIMLPTSNITNVGELNKAKYADTAIPLLIEEMVKLGAQKNNLIAKLAGGAQMFDFKTSNDMLRVGPRNAEASIEILREIGIPIVASETGGNFGRTIELDTTNGMLYIKTANQGARAI